MSLDAEMTPLEAGCELSERVMPGLEAALAKKYDDLLPGFSEWQISTVYGGVYARDGLDMKTRQLATVEGLAVMGAQTRPQLKIHVAAALKNGATKREIADCNDFSWIWSAPLMCEDIPQVRQLLATQCSFRRLQCDTSLPS